MGMDGDLVHCTKETGSMLALRQGPRDDVVCVLTIGAFVCG